MRKVKFKKWLGNRFEDDFNQNGLFHKWGNNYEEFEVGPGNYIVAIVELDNGIIVEVLPKNIKFDDKLDNIPLPHGCKIDGCTSDHK